MKKFLPFIFLAVFCVIFWNVVRFIYLTATGNAVFGISLFSDVCLPAVIGVTVGFITNLRQRG